MFLRSGFAEMIRQNFDVT